MSQAYFILLLLFTISLSISTAGMEIFSTLLILLFVVELSLDKLKIRKASFELSFNTGVGLILALFALSNFVSFFYSGPLTQERVERSLDLRWVPLFFATLYILRGLPARKVKIIIYTFLGFITLTCAYGYFQMHTGVDLIRGTNKAVQIYSSGVYRAAGFFGNPMTYGHNSAIWFAFSLFFAFQAFNFQKTKRLQDLFVLAVPIVTALGAYASYTRGGWVAAMGAVLFVFIPFVFSRLSKVKVLALFATALAAVSFVVAQNPILKKRLLSIVNLNYNSNQSRMYIWQTHLEVFKDHPIFGVGFNWNSELLREYFMRLEVPMAYWKFMHAHNHYIQLLAGLGIIGFTIYMVFLVKLLWVNAKTALSHWREQSTGLSLLLACLAAQVAFYIGGLTECNFSDLEVRYNFVFIIAIMFYLVHLHKNSQLKSIE